MPRTWGREHPWRGSVLGSVTLVSLMGNVVTPEGRRRACPCGLGRAATGASVLAVSDEGGPVNVTGTSVKLEEEERM